MKRERSGISLLLGSLLALSMLISAMYGSKPQITQKNNVLQTLTTQEMHDVLLPFMQADSGAKIIDSIANMPATKVYDLLALMIKNNSMSQKSLVEVVAGVADAYQDQESRYKIFDALLTSESLSKGLPWPLIIAYSNHKKVLKSFIEWARDRREQYPLLRRILGEAFEYAIDHENIEGLHQLIQQGAPLSPLRASKMLLRVAQRNNPKVAEFFIGKGADVNYLDKNGMTPLLQAVTNLQSGMVKYLLQQKADANKMGSIEIGTPLQIVQKFQQDPKKQAVASEIEALLREHGGIN